MALFMLLGLSTAMDMSIIDYDEKHGMGVPSDRTEAEVKALYESWLVKHRKNYNALGEKERRFEIFKDNLRFVDEHNKQSRSYKVGLNRFADLTNEEYRSIYLGAKVDRRFRLSGSRKSDRYAYRAGDELPESVDWRAKGAVAPVKDQGQCGELFIFVFIFVCIFVVAHVFLGSCSNWIEQTLTLECSESVMGLFVCLFSERNDFEKNKNIFPFSDL